MTQTALCFSRRPTAKELGLRPGSQTCRLYERLLEGAVTNAEIVRAMGIFNSTGRVSDLRERLRPFLMDVYSRPVKVGLWEYQLRG